MSLMNETAKFSGWKENPQPLDEPENERYLAKKLAQELERNGWDVELITSPTFLDRNGKTCAVISRATKSVDFQKIVKEFAKIYDKEKDVVYLYRVHYVRGFEIKNEQFVFTKEACKARFYIGKGERND